MRVLIAEDHERLARAVAAGLRRYGMIVDVALDGDDALARLGASRYDVVVLDRDLPGIHGDEICRTLAAERSESRVLMLTAANSVKDRVEGLGLGADDYLPKPFDFTEMVARVQALGRRPDADRLGIHLDESTEPAPLDGDPLLIERLVANLLTNAVRHNVAGGRVEVVTGVKEGKAVLSVTNTGPLIPPAEVDRLFQPFQRLDRHRANYSDGHGLGLSIVRAIVTAHDATVTARPMPDGGLSVSVIFPHPASPAASLEIIPEATGGPGGRWSPVASRP
jgi:DNA-binding response OmpR family regulator